MGAYRGLFRIVETLESHLTPARYMVEIGGIEASNGNVAYEVHGVT
jgi:hypothetical protein